MGPDSGDAPALWPTPPTRPPQHPDATAGGYPTGPPPEPRITYTADGYPVPPPPPIGMPADQPTGYPPAAYPAQTIIGYTPGGYPIIGGAAPPQQRTEAPFPAPRHRELDGFALASLVFGLFGGVLFAVAFGITALREPRKSRHRGAGYAVAGLVLALVWTAGFVVYLVHGAASQPTNQALQVVTTPAGSMDPLTVPVGGCAQVPVIDGSPVSSIPVVPCSQPHNGQVFTQITIPGMPVPGDPTFTSSALGQCRDAVPGFLGTSQTRLHVVVFLPSAPAFTAGARTALCYLVDRDKDITGDIRNDP